MKNKNVTFYKGKNNIGFLELHAEDKPVNVLSFDFLKDLENELEKIGTSKNIEVLVIKSSKAKNFIAGADINEIANFKSIEEARQKAFEGQKILSKIEEFSFPTVAIIDGSCLGGGLELALCCNYRIVSEEHALLGLPETSLGIIPGFGGTQRLPKLIGLVPSLSMILSGKPINGKKALKLGLANFCLPSAYIDLNLDKILKNILTSNLQEKKPSKLKKFFLEDFSFTRKLVIKSIKKEVMKKTKGNYPAQLLAIDIIEKTFKDSIESGLVYENEIFGELAVSKVCKNLVQIFQSSQEIKKETFLTNIDKSKKKTTVNKKVTKPKVSKEYSINEAYVVGAGIMGGGIAWLFTKMLIPVRLKDVQWKSIELAYEQIIKIYSTLKKLRKYKEFEIEQRLSLLSSSLEYHSLENKSLVIEAVVENEKVKSIVYKDLEKEVSNDTIIASNTSSIPIKDLAKSFKKPERFLGIHFFNPVNRMPLVEIIPHSKTSPEIVNSILSFLRKAGKTPVIVGDSPGFLINRILLPYLNEAAYILLETKNIKEIDQVIEKFGMPMGPFKLLDQVGLDVGYKVCNILEKAYGNRMKTCNIFNYLVDTKNFLGKKTNLGFYSYKEKNTPINQEVINWLKENHPKTNTLSNEEIIERCILIMANEAVKCLEDNVIQKVENLDLAVIYGTGFPPFQGGLLRYLDSITIDKTVKTLEKLSTKYGERFTPASLLLKMQKENKTFYL